MRPTRFDSLTRSFPSLARRGAVRFLALSALSGVLTLGVLPGHAKKGGGGNGKGKGKTCKGKVVICHKGQTKRVSRCALKRHRKHGDTKGPCPTESLCPAGSVECAGQCCVPGQSCAGGTACVNGTKAVGAFCTATLPGECSSGVCGCTVVGCICRTANCAGPGGACMGTVQCCQGNCAVAAGNTCVG
jgi:hypothetical protein